MVAQLQWTDADIASAHWAYLRRNPWRFVRYFRYSIAAIGVSFIIFIQYPESWQIVGWLVLVDAATIAYQMLLSRRNTDRQFKTFRLWNDTVSVNIDGKSIRLSGQTFNGAKNWSEFSDIYESKRVFMFGKTGNRAFFLPKAGMNESQIAELRTLISTYAKGKVKLAKRG